MLVFGMALFFIVKLFNLHFSDRIKVKPPLGPEIRRGDIKDRQDYLLALSIEKHSLFANPQRIKKPEETAGVLSPLIDLPYDVILERLKREKRFVWLKRKVDDATAGRIKALKIPGISFKREYQRVYPHDRLAANVIGFVGIDNRGLGGLEYRYDEILSGRSLSRKSGDDPVYCGYNLKLTIDRVVQYQCEKELAAGARAMGARQGAVVVMEVATGRILAAAKYPGFDPNFYYRYADNERRNYAITDSFEPGSTLKIIAMATVLETGQSLSAVYQCKGKVDVADTTINCVHVHGKVGLDDIIRKSCNAGMIQAMRGVGKKSYYDMLIKFGFGRKTGVELPGESEGLLRPLKEWSGLSKYSLAIGQEISVNSLQLAAAFSAVANDGVYVLPAIVEAVEKEDGTVLQRFYPRTRGRVIRKETAQRLLAMMRKVVEGGGTGHLAAVRYYGSAGKTGTAQKPLKTGGYSEKKYTSSFVGLTPSENPRICLLILLDEPLGAEGGGAAAAPVFARIAERILPYLRVKKTAVGAGGPVHYRRLKIAFDGATMPDFRGRILADSIDTLAEMQKKFMINYTFEGSGRVYNQSPPKGTALSHHQKITLYLKD